MTTQPENEDKAEQKVSKDELSDKDVEKVIGGTRSSGSPSLSEIVITKQTDTSSGN